MFNDPLYVAALSIIIPLLTLFLKKKIADAKEKSRREHEAPMDNIKNVAETIKIWKDIAEYRKRESEELKSELSAVHQEVIGLRRDFEACTKQMKELLNGRTT